MPAVQHNQEHEKLHRLQQQRAQQQIPSAAPIKAVQPNKISVQPSVDIRQQLQNTAGATEQEAMRLKLQRSRHEKKGIDLSSPAGIAKTVGAAATAFTEISIFKDWYHWLVIMLSLMGDLVTIIPLAGIAIGFAIYIVILTLYMIGGHFKKRKELKIYTVGFSWFIETVPILGVLPAMTLSAVLNYWYTLTDRKMRKT